MKLAIVDSWFHWPPVGGAIRSVKEIADRLSRRGVDVTVVAPINSIVGGEGFAFKVDPIRFNKFNGPVFYSGIRRALKRLSPDVVFVTSGNLLKPYMISAARGFPVLVRLYAYELRCPASYGILYRDGHVCSYSFLKDPLRCVTCTEDIRRVVRNTSIVDRPETFSSLKFAYPFYHVLVKSATQNITMAIATSNYMKSKFEGVIPLDRIEVMPDGVDSNFFVPRARPKRDYKVITMPGRTFDPLKGLDVLLKACTLLWQKRQDFRVVVTGSKRPGITDYPYVQSDLWLDDNDIPGMYANSDIVVVPSIWGEPFGLTALEGMSCEIPVVVSRIGGLQEIVQDGENGLFFEPGNHVDLAAKLEALLDDPEIRRAMGRRGREYVVKKYAWEKIIDDYEVILNGLAERGRRGTGG